MQALPRPKRSTTRDRVLSAALGLFNECGAGRVTTADIASASGINEGNLYYYFQRKSQLIAALFDDFAAAAVTVAERPLPAPSVHDLAAYQRDWFALMWEWRVFYRDGAELFALAPELVPRLEAMTARTQGAVRRVLAAAAAAGTLAAGPGERDALLRNTWIVSTFWMTYFRIETGRDPTREDLAWGWRQVEMLYRPYLADPTLPSD